jgi:hypothetical protein
MNTEVEKYLDGVNGVVEATTFEKMFLYEKHRKDGWSEIPHSLSVRVGVRDGSPVVVSISSAFVRGYKILFVEPTSTLVDYNMINKWLAANLPKSAFKQPEFYNSSHVVRLNSVDALNFHNVFPVSHKQQIEEFLTNGINY